MASTPRRPSALEHGSHRHETLPKRVSDDPRQLKFRREKFFSSRFFGLENRYTPFWSNFGGSMDKRASKSSSSQFFALDAPILRSVRLKIVKNMSVCATGSGTRRRFPPSPSPPMRPVYIRKRLLSTRKVDYLRKQNFLQFQSRSIEVL